MKKHIPILLLCLLSISLPTTTQATHQQPKCNVQLFQAYKETFVHFCKTNTLPQLPQKVINIIHTYIGMTLSPTPYAQFELSNQYPDYVFYDNYLWKKEKNKIIKTNLLTRKCNEFSFSNKDKDIPEDFDLRAAHDQTIIMQNIYDELKIFKQKKENTHLTFVQTIEPYLPKKIIISKNLKSIYITSQDYIKPWTWSEGKYNLGEFFQFEEFNKFNNFSKGVHYYESTLLNKKEDTLYCIAHIINTSKIETYILSIDIKKKPWEATIFAEPVEKKDNEPWLCYKELSINENGDKLYALYSKCIDIFDINQSPKKAHCITTLQIDCKMNEKEYPAMIPSPQGNYLILEPKKGKFTMWDTETNKKIEDDLLDKLEKSLTLEKLRMKSIKKQQNPTVCWVSTSTGLLFLAIVTGDGWKF